MSEDNNRLRFAPTRWEDLGKATTRRSSSGQQGTQRPASNPQWQAELKKQDAEIQALSNKLRAGGIGGREAGYLSETLKFMKMRRDDTLAKINSGREIKTTAGDVGREVINAPVRGAVGTVLGGVAGVADYLGFDESAESVRDYRDEFNKEYGAPEAASQNAMLRYGGMGGEALGSTVPYLAGGVASVPVRAAVGAMSFGGGVDQQDERVKQLREQGGVVSSGQEMLAETFGGLVGLSELIPVKGLLSRVPNGYGQKVVEMVGQRFASTAVGRAMAQGGKNAVGRVAGSAIEEGVQEAAAGVAQDLIELGVYNPNVEVGQSALQDFALGSFAGGTIRGGREVVGRIRGEDMNGAPATPPQTNTDQELLDALEERAAQGQASSTPLLEDQSGAALRDLGNISAGGMSYTPDQILDIARNNESNPRIADIMSQPVGDETKVQQVARILNQEEASRVEPEAIRRISGMFGGTNSVTNSRQMISDELAKIDPSVIAESPSLSAIAEAVQAKGDGKKFVNSLRNAVSNYQPTAPTGTLFARPERGGQGSVIMSQEDVTNEAQREREAQQAFRLADVRQRRFDTATGQGTQREDLRAGAPDPEVQFFLNPAKYGEELGGTVATVVGLEDGRVRIQYDSPTETNSDGTPVIISEDVSPTDMFDRVVRGTPRMSQELAGDLRKPRKGTGTTMNPRRSVDRTSTRALVPTQDAGLPATISPTRMTGFEENTDQLPVEQQAQNAQVNPQQGLVPNVEGNVEGPNEISGAPAQLQAPQSQRRIQPPAPVEPAPEDTVAQEDEEIDIDNDPRMVELNDKFDAAIERVQETENTREARKLAKALIKEGVIDEDAYADIDEAIKDETDSGYKHETAMAAIEDAIESQRDNAAADLESEIYSEAESGGDRYSGRTSKRKKRTYATGVAPTTTQADTKAAPQAEAQAEPTTEERTVRPENTDNNIDDVGRGVTKASDSVARNPTPRKDEANKRDTKKIDYEAVIEDRLNKIASRGRQGRIIANRLRSIMKQGGYTPKQFHYAFAAGDVMSRVLPKGASVDILFVPSLRATDAKAAAASGLTVGDENTGGYEIYDVSQNGMSGLITLSLSEDLGIYARESAAHEAFHVIQDMLEVYDPQAFEMLNNVFEDGMTVKQLDPSILRVLKATDMGNGVSFYDDLVANFGDKPLAFYEAQAVAFGALVNAKESGSPMRGLKATIARIVDMIQSFRREFGRLLRNENVISLADYFEGYRSGEAQEYLSDLEAPTKLTKVIAAAQASERYSGRKKDSATGEFKKNIKASKLSADELFAQPDVKQGTMGVTEAAIEIQKRTLSILGRPITAAGQKDDLLAQTVAHEVKSELARSGKRNASGWYTEEMRKATAVASMIHPEIATDVGAQLHFTAALAITSQNQSVDANAVFAERWYEHYKKNGKFPENEGWGKAASSIISNAKLFNSIVEKYGAEAVSKFFATKFTVRELRAAGFSNVSGASEEMVYGSAVLGPKIGFGFYSNLNGRYDPVTIDMWFMRTWGRMTGDLIGADPELIQQQEDRLTKALADDGRPTNAYGPELLEVAQAESKAFEKDFKVNRAAYDSGEKVKPETALAAQRLLASFEDTKDAPKADWQRTWIRDIVAKSQQILQGDGINITNADLQAVLWYPEKRLWSKKFGVREKGKGADDAGSAGETSYYDEFVRIAKKRGFTDGQISTAIQPKGGRGQGSGSVLGGKAVNQNANGQSGAANEFAPRDARRFIQDSVVTRLNKEFPILDGAGSATSGRPSEHISRKAGGNLARSVEGRTPVVATYSHSVKVKNALAVAGVDAPKFLELTAGPASAKLYHRLISEAQKANKAGAAVYVYDKKDYADMRLFLTEDGLTGFAIKGDDLVSVFKHPTSEARGVAIPLARMAVWLGARRLDAYDTVLPYLYSTAGFKVASRVKWSDEAASDNWDKTEFSAFNNGEPDVVFMYHDPARSDFYTKGEGEYFDQYDDAVAAQSSKAGNVQYSGRTNRAVYTPERTDLLLQDLSYPDDDNKTKAWITFMSPDQFLGLTLSSKGRDLLATMDPAKTRARPLNVDELRRVDQPLFLEIAEPYMASGKEQPRRVMGHEGRHRMAAFKAAGIEQVPVILRRQDGRAGQLEDLNNFTLAPQRGGRSDQYNSGDTSVVLSEAVPFNYANAGRIREMMSGEGIRFSGRRRSVAAAAALAASPVNANIADTPIAENSAIYKSLENGNAKQALAWLRQNSKSEDTRRIASILVKNGVGEQKTIILDPVNDLDSTIATLKKNGADQESIDLISAGNVRGMVLSTAKDKNIYLIKNPDQGANGVNEQTFLHEAIHAYVKARWSSVGVYNERNREPLDNRGLYNEQVAAEVEQFNKMWRGFTDAITEEFNGGAALPSTVISAAESPNEALAYLLTNKSVQDYAKRVVKDGSGYRLMSEAEAGKRSWWDDFVDMIRGIFGLSPSRDQFFNDFLDAGYSVLSVGEETDANFRVAAINDERYSGRRAQNTGGVSQSMMDKVVSEEPSVGVFGKFFDKMVGRIGNESRRRAFVRNVVNSKDGTFVLDRRLDAAIRGIDPADGRIPVDGSSVGRMMEMASQSTGVMQGALELGPPVFDGEITTFSDDISGLFDIFAPIGEERAGAFQTYAVARREKDLRAMGRVGFTQVTDAEIAETLRNADADFAEVFDAYQVFNGAIIDYAVDTGLLTEELGDTLKSMDYVPYYRAYEQDDGELDVLGPKMQAAMNNPKSALDLKLKGGSTGLGNLYENMIRNTQSIISAARKNLALQEAADAIDALNDLGVDDIGRRVDTPDGEGIMRLRVNGKPVYYQIEDPAVWASIASLGPQQMNVVVEAFSKFANVLRTSVTLAPSFMIANLWRGKISTYVTTDAKLTLGIDTFKGMKDAYQNGETTKIIKANTGIGGYAYGMGERDFANEVRRRYRRQEGGGYGFTRDWLDRLKSGLVAAERIGEATELAERVKLYNDIIASGGNPKSAAYEAMNLTNFGRKGAGQGYIGATMNVLIPMIPFLNARIQGLYRIAENQQNEPTIMGLRKKVLLRGMLYTLASSAIYAMFSDDDRWEEETVENKMLYDIMYLGDKTIYLPRPFEVGTIFGSMPIALYDYARDQDGREASDKLVFAFTNTFAMNPIPQGVKPTLESFVNYSFFRGGPIDTMADQNLPAGMRYDERTSEIAKAIGGTAGVSPKKVDYVLNGYLGTMGAGFISGVDSVLSGVGVIPKKAGGLFGDPYHIGDTIASASGLTRFVKDSDRTTSRFVSDFYELKREADQANRAHKKLIEEGRREEAIEYAEENKFPLQARKQLGQISKDISKVNKDIDKVEVDPKLTPAEKQLKLKPLLRKRKDLARKGYDYARGARIVPTIEEEEEAEE